MASPTTFNIHEAKTHLSRLVDDAVAGADVVIAKAGKAMVRLVPVEASRPLRTPGLLKGRIRIARDFDAPLPNELVADFERRE